MKRYERLNEILELVSERGSVSIEAIAEELRVSIATARRDLDHLASQQLLTRTRGGAVAGTLPYDLPLTYKREKHPTEKQRIAEAAAAMVVPGQVIGLNGGTTTTEVARVIAMSSTLDQADTDPALTIVTNALNIAYELTMRPHLKLMVVGGVVRQRSYELLGPLAERLLDEVVLDVAFIGADAFNPSVGPAAHSEGEARINHLMAERAQEVIVVADSSKLGRHAFARICRTKEVHRLITDTAAADGLVSQFEANGVEVTRV
jgi:DeoR family transcriptional regulator of aga operon